MLRVRLPFWATIFTVIAVTILCGLGTWQLQRLEWKTNLLAQIDAEFSKPVSALENDPQILNTDFEFKRMRLEGRYLIAHQITVMPRTRNGKIGKHVITPFKLENGKILIVNRGWVGNDWLETLKTNRNAEITGLISNFPSKNWFTPPNNPDQGEFYSINQEDFRKLDAITPYYMRLESDNLQISNKPNPTDVRLNIRNNHLQYAVFWYTMAALLIGIFVLRFRERS